MTVRDPTYITNQVDATAGFTDPIPGGQAAQTARRAPGQRVLSPREREQRQLALSPCVPEKEEAMCQCTKVLHFSVFFDGTGNNQAEEMQKKPAERALSNIAKLFNAHKLDNANVARRYVPGVGTPFPEIGDSGSTSGMAFGSGAKERIKKALELLDEEIAKVPAQQKLRLINVTVFGFSRGAASARAFIRDLAAQCNDDDGCYRYRDVPLRIAFSGLFDTVCSAYGNFASAMLSLSGGHNGWAADMKLPPMVEQSVHMIAAHEARRRFPLDSTRIDAAYPENTIEVWYPGVHSDVGGGYAPQAQGRENTVSRFALNHMFDLAFTSGVLFQRIVELDPTLKPEFDSSNETLREAFNAYIDAVPLKQGPMEEVQAAHMSLLHRWLKKRVAEESTTESMQRLRKREAGLDGEIAGLTAQARPLIAKEHDAEGVMSVEEQAQLDKLRTEIQERRKERSEVRDAMADLEEEDNKLGGDIARLRDKRDEGEPLTLREQTLLDAWEDETPLPEAVERFFDLFAHDSIAHFDFDFSRLSDWRTIFFGDTKYKPS